MKPTEHNANAASTQKTGLLATLRGLTPTKGSGASSHIPITLAFFATIAAAMALIAAPALAGGGSGLIDGRGWEMVSPPNKHGAVIEPMTNTSEGGLIQAAEDGSGIVYFARGAIEASAAGNTLPDGSQVLSRRGPAGWSSQDIAVAHESVVEGVNDNQNRGYTDFKLFSPDLSIGLLEPVASHTDSLYDSATGSVLPLTPGRSVEFEGASPDLSHVVYSSGSSLYEWAGGESQLVSLLPPNGEGKVRSAAEEGYKPSLGYAENLPYRGAHAVSSTGSHVVWEDAIGFSLGHLYLSDTAKGETVQLDAVQEGAGGGQPEPVFQTMSEDGSRAFFTDTEQLTVGSHAHLGTPDLYVYEVSSGGGPLSGTLRDLTPEGSGGESAGVGPEARSVLLGASEDGSYVYFVATGMLANGAKAGSPNLYVEHYAGTGWEKPKLVAVLGYEDQPDWLSPFLTSRASPDGRYLAFMSAVNLTSYDSEGDEEVYLYDANTGRLACASCDPSSRPPEAISDPSVNPLFIDRPQAWSGRSIAGSIAPWTPVTNFNATIYQSDYLSNSGRLFFNSPGALVPGDVNGKEDVYEFEPVGIGNCEESTGGNDVVFSRAAGGCVGLISSGTSSEETAFLDASATGGDVFFLTSAPLSPSDVDDAFDVYDAHECTTQSPCLTASAGASSALCATPEACRGAGSATPAFGAPASASFSGSGNASPPVPVAAGRSLSRSQKLALALKACRREPKKKRAKCQKQANKSFGKAR